MLSQLVRPAGVGVLLTMLLTAAGSARAANYEFDQRRTEVRFVYTMAYSTQRGRFTRVTGSLVFDGSAPEKAKVNAEIASASLTTDQPIVDNELKGASFFNVRQFPTIGFKSRAVRAQGTTAEVDGDITINGVTRPITLQASLKPHDDPALKYDAGSLAFLAKTRINRSNFGMTDYQSMVADEIEIEIEAVVRPRK